MELPKLNYDDFYKFLISTGLILFFIAITIILILVKYLLVIEWIIVTIAVIVSSIIIIVVSIILIIWAGNKWYKNQTLLDKKLKSEVQLIQNSASRIFGSQKIDGIQSTIENIDRQEVKTTIALVSYKISQALPNSVSFNFLKDWKVWFWIANHDPKKYKAYVKIKFIFEDSKNDLNINDGYYGGTRAWKLDPFSGIQAPGLEIPEKVKNVVRVGERIKIQISCEIRNENDNLIEKKFPQTYVYNPLENNWFLEP